SYLNLPKSIILQTGGAARGLTSTSSSPFSSARRSASWGGMIPIFEPSAPITRTSGTPMRRPTRALSAALVGGGLYGLGMFFLLGLGRWLVKRAERNHHCNAGGPLVDAKAGIFASSRRRVANSSSGVAGSCLPSRVRGETTPAP